MLRPGVLLVRNIHLCYPRKAVDGMYRELTPDDVVVDSHADRQHCCVTAGIEGFGGKRDRRILGCAEMATQAGARIRSPRRVEAAYHGLVAANPWAYIRGGRKTKWNSWPMPFRRSRGIADRAPRDLSTLRRGKEDV